MTTSRVITTEIVHNLPTREKKKNKFIEDGIERLMKEIWCLLFDSWYSFQLQVVHVEGRTCKGANEAQNIDSTCLQQKHTPLHVQTEKRRTCILNPYCLPYELHKHSPMLLKRFKCRLPKLVFIVDITSSKWTLITSSILLYSANQNQPFMNRIWHLWILVESFDQLYKIFFQSPGFTLF